MLPLCRTPCLARRVGGEAHFSTRRSSILLTNDMTASSLSSGIMALNAFLLLDKIGVS